MQPNPFEQAIAQILETEKRFQPGAYFLVREVLDFTVDRLSKGSGGGTRHVSGRELLEGFRDYLIQEFGPMSATLLADWGLSNCREVGEIVFLFIEHGIFGKQDSDTLDDFDEIYTFEEAFTTPFRAA